MTETKYLVFGHDTKNDRMDCLAYITTSKAEAYAKAKHNYPFFDVYGVTEAAPDQY